jgi:hypothetical protein
MNGLLGDSWDDPRTMGLLQLAASLSSAPKPMQGLTQGLLAYQNAIGQGRRQKQEDEDRAMRRQMAELQLRQAQQQAAKAQAIDAAYKGAIRTPDQMAMAAHGGPTNAAAQAAPGMAPGVDQNALLRGLMQADPQAAFQMLQPKPADYKVVGDALLQVGPGGVKEAYRAPAKPEAMPTSIQEYLYAQKNPDFLANQLRLKQAGATRVNVDSGPKAFDSDLGKFAVDTFAKQRESAQAAAGVLQSVGEIRKAVQGGAYQGAGAELKLGAAKALGALGMPYDANTVANTELFNAQAKSFVLSTIKTLGPNPSNADREFIEQTIPRLQTDPTALPKLLAFMERKAGSEVTRYNSNAKKVQSRAGYLPFSLEVQTPESTPAPDVLTPAEQAELTALRAQLGGR